MSDKPLTFLYVEDDKMSREVMGRMLQGLASDPDRVTIWEDSNDFLDKVRKIQPVPDVVFLDVQIGPIDGFEMLKLLKQEPAYAKTPVIAMTASVTVSEIEQLRTAGFDGLIAKPVRKRIFPELVQKILDGEDVWYVP
ncbi:MAG: hypothetical protein Kow00117_22490 [Phototrophicales bacterium]|nr:MAG: hypothetical protein CUN56_01395 [Phototrophicales bacterium]RMG74717.1 MAG: response regulator [Chloroflexota bacterium]